MLKALDKTISQLNDKRLIKVLLKSAAIAVIVFIIFWGMLFLGIAQSFMFDIPFLGDGLQWLSGWFSVGIFSWIFSFIITIFSSLLIFLSLMLFPIFMIFITSFFFDEVIKIGEENHYSSNKRKKLIMRDSILSSLKFIGLVAVLNLCFLPVYLLLLASIILSPLAGLLYYGLNGYLIGREFFEIVAINWLDKDSIIILRKEKIVSLSLVGSVVFFLLSIPILNLFISIVGLLVILHLFHAWNKTETSISLKFDLNKDLTRS